MTARFDLSREQLFDDAGNPLAGGKIYFFAGGTLTPLNTYSDAGLTSVNANPVVCDSAGRAGDIFLQNETYRVQLKTSD